MPVRHEPNPPASLEHCETTGHAKIAPTTTSVAVAAPIVVDTEAAAFPLAKTVPE
jgi:hypothetical protein